MIYFIQGKDSKRIKIGYTKNDPEKRLASMQTGSPDTLALLFTIEGSLRDEAKLHWYFDDLRAHGEWFECKGDLATFISKYGSDDWSTDVQQLLTNARADGYRSMAVLFTHYDPAYVSAVVEHSKTCDKWASHSEQDICRTFDERSEWYEEELEFQERIREHEKYLALDEDDEDSEEDFDTEHDTELLAA